MSNQNKANRLKTMPQSDPGVEVRLAGPAAMSSHLSRSSRREMPAAARASQMQR